MIRSILLGLVAVTCAAGPASAATFTNEYTVSGTLNGVITSGGYYDCDCGYYQDGSHPINIDFTGAPVTIKFTADVKFNYADDNADVYLPRLVTDTVDFIFPIADNYYYGSDDINFTGTNGYSGLFINFGDFMGNAEAGTLNAYSGIRNDVIGVNFSYAGATPMDGPLTGSGSEGTYTDGAFTTQSLDTTFKFLSGSITSTGTIPAAPEPETWALMIAGFGAIGGMLRRRLTGAGAGYAEAMEPMRA